MQFMKFIFLESVSQVFDLPQLLPHYAVSPDSARLSRQSLSLAGAACDAQSLHPDGRVNFFTLRVPQSVTKISSHFVQHNVNSQDVLLQGQDM